MPSTTGEPALSTTSARKPLYEASTQFKNWRFSPERLTQIRVALNGAAVNVIRNTFEADEPGSSSNVSFLSWDEEHLLVKLYISKISQLCGHFRFPEEVEATAVTYLKRFYLKNTVMDWHPKNVMLTALFLATKTTNNPISLEAYTNHIPKTSPSDVLDLEFLVAQSLGFEFAVWHSHRALWGIVLDLQNLAASPEENSIPDSVHAKLYDSALMHVRASRLTDAELIYTPAQIALAALSLTSPDLASRWAQSKIPSQSSDTSVLSSSSLQATVTSIASLITSSGCPPHVESVREVDRRLKLCKNPEKVVGSKAYLAKKVEEEKKAEEKRSRKAVEVQRAITDGDPFGDELQNRTGLLYDEDEDD